MTKKEKQFINDLATNRKKIYELMLTEFQNSRFGFVFGFCWVFDLVMQENYGFNPEVFTEYSIGLLPELMEYKPNHLFGRWFSIDKKGKQKRIEILKEIISKL